MLDRCVIGSRDRQIFQTLDLFRVLALEQIGAHFFEIKPWKFSRDYLLLAKRGRADRDLSTAYQRMMKLVRFGYLDTQSPWGYPRVFRLDWKGYRCLSKAEGTEFRKPPSWPRKGEMEHALLLSGIGLMLCQKSVDLRTERQMLSARRLALLQDWRQAGREPLADMMVLREGKAYRLELELSPKSRQEYVLRWKKLGSDMSGSEPKVFYVAKGANLKGFILRVAKEEYKPAVYAAELAKLRETGPQELLWENFRGRQFQFEEGKS